MRRNAAVGPPGQVQPKDAIHPVDPFVITAVAVEAQAVMALPEAPAGMGRDHPLERPDQCRVQRGGVHGRGIPRRPCQSDDAAGATDRELMLRSGSPPRLPSGCQRSDSL